MRNNFDRRCRVQGHAFTANRVVESMRLLKQQGVCFAFVGLRARRLVRRVQEVDPKRTPGSQDGTDSHDTKVIRLVAEDMEGFPATREANSTRGRITPEGIRPPLGSVELATWPFWEMENCTDGHAALQDGETHGGGRRPRESACSVRCGTPSIEAGTGCSASVGGTMHYSVVTTAAFGPRMRTATASDSLRPRGKGTHRGHICGKSSTFHRAAWSSAN